MSPPRDWLSCDDREARLAGAIRAALARIRGEWDQPDLMAFGPLLPDKLADVTAILEQVEGDL